MNSYQHFALLAFLVLIPGLSFVIWRWPYGIARTFSQHVARHTAAIIYYIGLFTIVLPILLLFFFGWFIPYFQLPWWYGAFVIVACAAQYACTFIPEVGVRKTKYHRLLAGISALSLLPVVFMLPFFDTIPPIGKIVALAASGVMLTIIYLVFRGKAEHRYLLLLQSSYFLAFFFGILGISYS